MDLLNVEYNLIQAKRAYLRFTYKKKCCICDAPISDKVVFILFSTLLYIRMPTFAIKLALKKKRTQFAPLQSKISKRLLSIDYVKIYQSSIQDYNCSIKIIIMILYQ